MPLRSMTSQMTRLALALTPSDAGPIVESTMAAHEHRGTREFDERAADQLRESAFRRAELVVGGCDA